MTINDIIAIGRQIAAETAEGGNTAARVGGVIEAIGEILKNQDYMSWQPAGNFDIEEYYEKNDQVFDAETNSCYVSLQTDNVGHPVNENDESYEEGWWMKVIDGASVLSAAAAATQAAAEANQAAEAARGIVYQAVDDHLDTESLKPVANQVVTQAINNLSENLQDVEDEVIVYDAANTPYWNSGKWINNNNTWANDSNAKYYMMSVNVGETYKITANANGNVHYAFLTSNSTSGSAAYVSGTGRNLVSSSTSQVIVIPSTCTYLYILAYYSAIRLDKLEIAHKLCDEFTDLKLENTIEVVNGVQIKQGYYNTDTGAHDGSVLTRAVTSNIPKGTLIICKAGYYVRGVYNYSMVDGQLVYNNFVNYSSSPYAAYYVDGYCNLLFQKGDGTENVDIDDVIESVKTGVEILTGATLHANVEAGGYSIVNNIPSKLPPSENPNRMRASGIFSSKGSFTIICKAGYEANITFYQRGVNGSQYSATWSNSHICISKSDSSTNEFLIHFRRSDNGNISSSDLDCVQLFYYDDIIDGKILDKQPRPKRGFVEFSVSCNTIVADTINTATTLQDSEVAGNDKCKLYFPKTYSQYGKPTRLIIHCHGASVNYNYNNFSDLGIDNKFLNYWTAQGYAVLFVSGMAGNSTLQIGTTAGNPLAYQCHVKAYKYVVDNYNICRDGCFIVGISAGSIPALQIANFTDIPVLAQVIYCGIYSVPRAFMLLGGYSTYYSQMKQYIADMYDFQGTLASWSSTDPVSDAEWKYINDNVLRFAGWNTFLKGASTRMSQEDYADFVSDYYGGSLPSWIDNQNITFDTIDQLLMAIKVQQKNTQSPSGNLLTAVNAEKKLYDSVSISRDVPLKIFHATDDNIAPYRYAQYYYDMLKRGGSQVEFRTFPSGGHSPYGDTITVDGVETCVTAVEALLFLQRFE